MNFDRILRQFDGSELLFCKAVTRQYQINGYEVSMYPTNDDRHFEVDCDADTFFDFLIHFEEYVQIAAVKHHELLLTQYRRIHNPVYEDELQQS